MTHLLIAYINKVDDSIVLKGHSNHVTIQDMAELQIFAVDHDTWLKIMDEFDDLDSSTTAFGRGISEKKLGRIEAIIEQA